MPWKDLTIAGLVVMIILAGSIVYFQTQSVWLNSSYTSAQIELNGLQRNQTELYSQFAIINSSVNQLESTNSSLANRVSSLSAMSTALTEKLARLHSLTNRTVITQSLVVFVGPWNSSSASPPPEALVANFTAGTAGYVVVTIQTNSNVGELYLSIWSDIALCSNHRYFCETGSSPGFLPDATILSPVLPGTVQVSLGNYNNYGVHATVTVEYYG